MSSGIISTDDEAIADFAGTLRGTLLRPDDEGYDEARTVWNATIDKRPALVVRCAGVADVIDAVAFAKNRTCPSR